MTLDAVAKQLDRLSRLKAGRQPVVSCYLKIEPRDRGRGKYLIKLKNRIRDVTLDLPAQGYSKAEQEAIRADLDRIEAALASPTALPATQGVAVFASQGRKLFEVVPLPTVYRSRLVVDRSAWVRELLAVDDEVGRLLTVVMDRRGARFFEVTAFECREVLDLRADAPPGGRYHSDRRDAPGQGEHGYHNKLRTEKQRHLAAVADALFTLDRNQPVHGILLAGIGTDAGAVEPFLHPYLGDRVMGIMKLNLKHATPAAVHAATLEGRSAWERLSEADLVGDLNEALGARWAVNGVRPTLAALGKGQVRTLLVNPDVSIRGYRCTDTGRLVLGPHECKGEGAPVEVRDVIDDAIEEALRQRVDIEVIHSADSAESVDGLASLLRFR